MKNSKNHLWLRFVSAAIDLSAVYSISIIFQFFIWKFAFVSFCDIFVCVFVLYYSFCYLAFKGISPAKLLTGLKIVDATGGDIRAKNILLREIISKLFIGIIVPGYILQLFFPFWSPFITVSIEFLILFISMYCYPC